MISRTNNPAINVNIWEKARFLLFLVFVVWRGEDREEEGRKTFRKIWYTSTKEKEEEEEEAVLRTNDF